AQDEPAAPQPAPAEENKGEAAKPAEAQSEPAPPSKAADGETEKDAASPAAVEDSRATKDAGGKPVSSQPSQPAQAPGPVAAQEPAASDLVGGTRVELTFGEPIAHDALADLVQNSAHALSLKDIVFQLKNPDYRPPSEARYNTWTLETSLKTDQTEA